MDCTKFSPLRTFVACETPPLLPYTVLALGIYGKKLFSHIGLSSFFRQPIANNLIF